MGKVLTYLVIAIVLIVGVLFWKSNSGSTGSSSSPSLRFEDTIGVNQSPFASLPNEQIAQRVSQVKSEMRYMATAIESYFVDCNQYPTWTPPGNSNSISPDNQTLYRMPTFRQHQVGGAMTITTPISYVTNYPTDPFVSNTEGVVSYAYFAIAMPGGWILISPGPDGDFDIIPERAYISDKPQPSPELLALSYDPTNGTISDGDIFRVKQ